MRSCVLGHDNGVFIVLSFCDSNLYVMAGTTKLHRHWEKVGRQETDGKGGNSTTEQSFARGGTKRFR